MITATRPSAPTPALFSKGRATPAKVPVNFPPKVVTSSLPEAAIPSNMAPHYENRPIERQRRNSRVGLLPAPPTLAPNSSLQSTAVVPPVRRPSLDKPPREPRPFRITPKALMPNTYVYESSIGSKSDLSVDTNTMLNDVGASSEREKSKPRPSDFRPPNEMSVTAPLRAGNVNEPMKPQRRLSNSTPLSTSPMSIPGFPRKKSPERTSPPITKIGSVSRSNSISRMNSPLDSASDTTMVDTSPYALAASMRVPASRKNSKDDNDHRQQAGKILIRPPDGENIASRTVRWKEGLICPSPITADKRRRGWFNRRGDQLWTNDGQFVPAEPHMQYPPDLDEYPEADVGWMNEEGLRIDKQHRLIPKAPLRSAMKKTDSGRPTALARTSSDRRMSRQF